MVRYIISYSMRAEWNMVHTQWENFIPHEAEGRMGYASLELGMAIFHEARVE